MEPPLRQFHLRRRRCGAAALLLGLECAPFSAASLQTIFILYALPQRSVLALGLPALSVPSSRFIRIPVVGHKFY